MDIAVVDMRMQTYLACRNFFSGQMPGISGPYARFTSSFWGGTSMLVSIDVFVKRDVY